MQENNNGIDGVISRTCRYHPGVDYFPTAEHVKVFYSPYTNVASEQQLQLSLFMEFQSIYSCSKSHGRSVKRVILLTG